MACNDFAEDDEVLSSVAAADRASILIEFTGTRAKKVCKYIFNYETVARGYRGQIVFNPLCCSVSGYAFFRTLYLPSFYYSN